MFFTLEQCLGVQVKLYLTKGAFCKFPLPGVLPMDVHHLQSNQEGQRHSDMKRKEESDN